MRFESTHGTTHLSSAPARRVRALAVVLVCCLAGAVAAGCQVGRDSKLDHVSRIVGKRVTVVVTTDGGKELVIKQSIPLKRGMTALDALQGVADVRLGPGGVIAQVNGLGGGALTALGPERAGWFYRVNGVESDKEPSRFRLAPGASLWWDLRRYDIYQRLPVAIGVFPEPLFSGYRENTRPLRIAYGTKFEKDAESISDALFEKLKPEIDPLEDEGGFGSSEGAPIPNVAVRKDRANLVIARWEEARLDPYIADIGFDPRGFGLTVWIENNDIRRQNPDEEFPSELDTAEGIVWASTIDGEPDGALVVLVTGITDEGVRAAARALRSGGFEYYLAGAVTREGKVLP